MEFVSASRLATFRECPRKYELTYVRGRTPLAESSALSFGRAMHEALERWWLTGPESAVQWLLDQADTLPADDGARIAAMLSNYNAPREQFKVIGVEQELEVPIVNPDTRRPVRDYRLFVKVDVLVEDADGERCFVEHKTTSQEILGFGPYWQKLSIDGQVGVYMLATGVRRAYYDVLRKPMLRASRADEQVAAAEGIDVTVALQRRMEAEIAGQKERYYQFRPLEKTPADLEESRSDLYQQVQMLHNCHRRTMFPRNSNACIGVFGACPFLEVCSGMARLDDPALFRDRTDVHAARVAL